MNNEINTETEQEHPAMEGQPLDLMEQENYSIPPESEMGDTAFSSPLIAEDGAFAPDWYARFEELAPAEKTLSKFKRPEALAKSYAELEKLRAYPDTEDASRMALFRSFVGLPENAEDFHLDCPEGVSAECWNEALAGDMAKVAHEYGIPARAMNALAQTYAKRYENYLEESEAARETGLKETEEVLRREWGNDFDKARGQAVSGVRLLAGKAGVSSSEILETPELASNPVFIKLMREVSLMMDEAPLRRGGEEHPIPVEEARRIESDPSHPLHDAYMKPAHPNHRYANDVYDRLAFRGK